MTGQESLDAVAAEVLGEAGLSNEPYDATITEPELIMAGYLLQAEVVHAASKVSLLFFAFLRDLVYLIDSRSLKAVDNCSSLS